MAGKVALAARAREEERQRLSEKIREWNDHRWDLFELSTPNEDCEFHGVMRFYFQDPATPQTTTTKCVRVSSTASVRDIITILIEKFRPDMRLLGNSNYALYEVHGNGDERQLGDGEMPLLIQLNWHEDARDGRFLLKNEDDQTRKLNSMTDGEGPIGSFKRKLSKREKKEKKKKEKEAKLKGKENETPNKGSVAEKLYNELPETSFTRSISNPEAVMRRRRQQKLEKKLQQFKSRDGGPDSGGTLKIYGESLRPDVPYKTLLLSVADTALYVLKETLDKYGMEKEDPNNFVLVQRIMGVDKDYILDDEDCPLAILMNHPPSKGTMMFHIRRRTADMPKKRKKKSGKNDQNEAYDPYSGQMNMNALPFLVELNPDGSEPPRAKRLLLPLNVTEVGSQRSMAVSGQYLQLYAPDIHPRHCVIAHTDGIVTVTPTSKEADTYVENHRVFDTTLLQHGMIVRFGTSSVFRFIEPHFEEKMHGGPPERQPVHGGPPPYDHNDPHAAETTFDVDGHIETNNPPEQFQKMGFQGGPPDYHQAPQAILPALLEFREEAEQPFLMSIISEVNGAAVQFKLAPTYTLYMAARYRLSRFYRPDMPPQERVDRLAVFLNRVASMTQHTIQENQKNAGALSFWMANASELLHFVKQDVGLSGPGLDAQDMLAEAVQVAFRYLVHCMQLELRNTMVAFLDDADHDLDDDAEDMGPHTMRHTGLLSDVLQVLSSAMSLLRRCRVNAALTIQLFSQLFHYINMWLFNKLVLEPRLGLCTRLWGHRLKQRLGRVEIWAEKQGLELAADCHLARIIQAAHLLQSPKSSQDDIASISSTCFKLNSLQLHALLSNYIPGPGEPRIPPELIDSVVAVAKNTADELTRSDGREVRLEEEPDLQLPFLLPEDGYSCDIVRGIPNGLAEFLDPLSQSGILRLSPQPQATGLWTVHMTGEDPENLRGMQGQPGPGGDHHGPPSQEPETVVVVFDKVNGSMGLSIVAAKGEGQEKRGIYIKSVVPGGAAALDGRLRPGDQLLEVDGMSLIGLTQEKAAELMTRTGHTVKLTVGKQGAIYHGLGALLNTPSPTLPRGSPRRSQGAGGKGMSRPKSEEMSRFGPQDGGPGGYGGPGPSPGGPYDQMQRPLHQQMGAQSSPALAGSRSQEQLRDVGSDKYGGYPGTMQQSQSYHNDLNRPQQPQHPYQYGTDPAGPGGARSKSTSNLDRQEAPYGGDYRPSMSMGTLPGRGGNQQPQPQRGMLDRPGSQPELYQPDLRWIGPDKDRDYENYPGPQQQQQQQQPQPQQQHPQQGPPHAGDRYGPPPSGMDPRYGVGQPPQQQQPQPNYMNHQQIREQYGYGSDPPRNDQRPEHGMPGHGMPPHMAEQPPQRSRSQQEMMDSRVAEWQRQNEPWNQRDYTGGPPPQGMYGGPEPEPGRPQMSEEPPRGGPQYQQQYPSGSNLRGREATPPGPDRPPHDMKPATPTKAGMRHPQDIPGRPDSRQDMGRMDNRPGMGRLDSRPDVGRDMGGRLDSRSDMGHGRPPQEMNRSDSRQGGNMYDPRGPPQQQPQPQQGPPNGYPPSSQYPGFSQASSQPPPHQMQYGSPQADTRTVPSGRDKTSPPSRQDYRRNETPDLPPPPPDVPPPGVDPRDWHPQEGEHLPPPPPPPVGTDMEQQIRDEQETMMRRMAGLDPYGRDPQRGDQRFVSNQQQPEPQRPSPPGSNQPNYNQGPYGQQQQQQQPPLNNTRQPFGGQSQPQQTQPRPNQFGHQYMPKKQENKPLLRPSEPLTANDNKKRPPVAAKPKVLPKPNGVSPSPSPWERDEKERINKVREEDVARLRDREIQELEDRPYLVPEEQERLRRLRLDQEFERRVREASKDDEEEGDSDNDDITDRPAGRAVLFRQMQEDLEKKRQQVLEGHAQRDREQEQAEREKIERQERRLHQFEQEREEQKQRQMKRQEKQEREAEAYLAKQRELRERQRREQEEQQRNLRMEEERRLEKQREDLRRKREMEKEQLRESALQREAEERAREDEMRLKQLQQQHQQQQHQHQQHQHQQDINRNDRYSYDPAYRAQPAPPSQPGPPPQPNYPPPTPPERRSSYDIANLRGTANMAGGGPDHRYGEPAPPAHLQPQTPRSANSSALRQPEAPSSAKKSVSFNSNLAIEINEKHPQYPSTSSETSLYDRQPEANNNYPYRGSSSSSTSDPPPTPFQRPNYGPSTPTTQESNEVFDQRTPTNQGPPPTLVPGPTPGVVGAQEIYRDPRDRIAAKKAATAGNRNPGPERMSFRDKMSMFAREAGEQNTPKDRAKTSRAQRVIETDLNGQSAA